MPAKLGLNGRRQLVLDNAAVMEQEGYEAKKEVRKLKIELSKCRKTIKEFQTISNTPMELKRQTSFHKGWEKMKNGLKWEMMETIGKLASHVYKTYPGGCGDQRFERPNDIPLGKVRQLFPRYHLVRVDV